MNATNCIDADKEPRWFDLEALLTKTFCRHIVFRRQLSSTNDHALQLAATAAPTPLLVLTESQTAGRGRGSNRWWATDGALTFSLVLEPKAWHIEPARLSLVSLTVAIAVADTLSHLAPGCEVGLKWPNDVRLNGRKVCGILMETLPARSDRLIIGAGLNVGNSLHDAPQDIRSLATSLCDETGHAHRLSDVLECLLQHVEKQVEELGAKRLVIHERWRKQCVLTGQVVSLDIGERRIEGVCRGIADNGAILIDSEGAVRPWFGGIVRELG